MSEIWIPIVVSPNWGRGGGGGVNSCDCLLCALYSVVVSRHGSRILICIYSRCEHTQRGEICIEGQFPLFFMM